MESSVIINNSQKNSVTKDQIKNFHPEALHSFSNNSNISQNNNNVFDQKINELTSDPLAASMIASLSNVTPFVTPFYQNSLIQPNNVQGFL